MKVTLISHTPDPLKVLYLAARTCYSPEPPSQMEIPSEEKIKKIIKNVYDRGHESVLEHVSFTFALEGVSRAMTHQLVRHRLASYSQQSQRYVRMKKEVVVPESIKKRGFFEEFSKEIERIFSLYERMIENGIPEEDARYILPNATTSNIVVTMNLRELIHVAGLRLCFRAQWEIRRAVALMKWEVKKVNPFLSSFLVPRCVRLGYCPEKESCGLMPRRSLSP